jgi:hypothetical protein
MKLKLNEKFEKVQRSYWRARPRSSRCSVLYREMVRLKQQIINHELKGKSK